MPGEFSLPLDPRFAVPVAPAAPAAGAPALGPALPMPGSRFVLDTGSGLPPPPPVSLPALTGPIRLDTGPGPGAALPFAPVSGGGDLRPLFAGQAAQQAQAAAAAAQAPVDPSRVLTGPAPQAQGGAAGGAGGGYLDEWNALTDARKREILRGPQGGGLLRPPAPEPLLRLGRLQGEQGKIEEATARADRDLSYRKADNAGDLVAEQQAGIKRLEDLDAQNAARMAEAQKSLDAATAALASGEYDHDRLWHKASDNKRAGFMVGAVLAGLGQAIAGQGGQQNRAMSTLFQLMDRDNEGQVKAIESNRAKAGDAAKLYRDVLEKTGSDRAAVAALNIMKLDALKSQFDAEYQKLVISMPVAGAKVDLQYGTPYVVDAKTGKGIPGAVINEQGVPIDPRTKRPIPGARVEVPTTGTGQPLPTTMLDLRLDAAKNAIGQRRAQEELALQQAIAAATRPIGGGGGGKSKLEQIRALTKEQLDAQNEAAKQRAALAKDAPPVIYAGGERITPDPSVPKELVVENQKKINMADQGLATVASLRSKLANAGPAGWLEKGARLVGADRVANALSDEGRVIGADQVTGLQSQLSGAGVPSETQSRLMQQVLSGGPGAAKALDEIQRILGNARQVHLQNLGAK